MDNICARLRSCHAMVSGGGIVFPYVRFLAVLERFLFPAWHKWSLPCLWRNTLDTCIVNEDYGCAHVWIGGDSRHLRHHKNKSTLVVRKGKWMQNIYRCTSCTRQIWHDMTWMKLVVSLIPAMLCLFTSGQTNGLRTSLSKVCFLMHLILIANTLKIGQRAPVVSFKLEHWMWNFLGCIELEIYQSWSQNFLRDIILWQKEAVGYFPDIIIWSICWFFTCNSV